MTRKPGVITKRKLVKLVRSSKKIGALRHEVERMGLLGIRENVNLSPVERVAITTDFMDVLDKEYGDA